MLILIKAPLSLQALDHSFKCLMSDSRVFLRLGQHDSRALLWRIKRHSPEKKSSDCVKSPTRVITSHLHKRCHILTRLEASPSEASPTQAPLFVPYTCLATVAGATSADTVSFWVYYSRKNCGVNHKGFFFPRGNRITWGSFSKWQPALMLWIFYFHKLSLVRLHRERKSIDYRKKYILFARIVSLMV